MEFREVQKFRQAWLWIVVVLPMVAVAAVFGYGLVTQLVFGQPWGDRPLSDQALGWTSVSSMAVSLGVVWLLYVMQLVTEVRSNGIYLRFFPLAKRFIPFGEIRSCVAREYRPIMEYGGWGIRWGGKGKAWNVSGNRGVQLVLERGKPLLIGSRRADELAAAINAGRGRDPATGPSDDRSG